jgi:putative aminopeptidase FrvX
MESAAYEFLRALVEVGGPSGYEQPVQAIYREQARAYGATVETDVLGNAIATLNAGGSPRVMLAGHADEIGFLVRWIDDDGFIYFAPVGGWDAEIPVGQRVTVHAAGGPVPGVIGKRAIHLMDEEDRRKKSDLAKLWIDIGAAGREAAEAVVAVGDPITMRQPLERLQGDLATAKSFDNRMAVWICAETIRLLAGRPLRASLFSVSTVQEEIGLRGARTSSFGISPSIGIALDVCHATDYPEADKRRVGDIRLGRGPVVHRGANINPRVFELLVAAARAESIPIQIEAAPAGTGTDANAMQLNQAGMATGIVSVPLRYMHTPCETLSLTDLENAARLCAAFVARLTGDDNLIP